MKHTRHGFWLEEAGAIEPMPPLDGAQRADVAVVGGGYLGLWTAWHLAEEGAEVAIVEADLCGHGPSGRNGGFVSSLWDQLPGLVSRYGTERAVAVGSASAAAVRAIGDWCRECEVDAWYHAAPQLEVATTAAQDGAWNEVIRACRAAGVDEAVELDAARVQAVCASPVFRAGMSMRTSATVQPARLALGLRRRLLERSVRIFEQSPVRRLTPNGVEADDGSLLAAATVLAVNSSTASFPGFRGALAVASSHIVLTEPVPEVLDELGWAGGEAVADARTLLHYFRTTKDGRIAFGWGGPIDVSPTHLPVFGSRGRVHHGYGFTGNGVGPSYLGGQILAALALDRRNELSRLALVEPPRARFPPEPLRFVGGTAIRRALVAKDAAEDEGGRPGSVTRIVAGLPRRLGLHLPR